MSTSSEQKTALNHAIKTMFYDAEVKRLACAGHALLSIALRDEEFRANNTVRTLRRGCRAVISRGKDYEFVDISGQMLMAYQHEPDSMIAAFRECVTDGIEELGDRMSANLFAEKPQRRDYVSGDFTDCEQVGLPAWHPREVTSGDNFMGLCRNGLKHVRGEVIVTAGCADHEAVLYAEGRARAVDPLRDGFFIMNPERHERVLEAWRKDAAPAEVYGGTRFFSGGRREYLVIPDTDCPLDEAWRIPNNSLTIASIGAAPHVLDRDGVKLVSKDYDAWRLTLGAYYNVICDDPGKWVRVLWS